MTCVESHVLIERYRKELFAVMGAAVTPIIPMLVRYITNDVIYFDENDAQSWERSFCCGEENKL